MIDWKKWRHVTKLDPDKPIKEKDVAAIVDSAVYYMGLEDFDMNKILEVKMMA